MKTPRGFSYAGINCGIKVSRKDLALIYSETPCSAAGCFTVNAARAAPVRDAARRLPSRGIRAIVANSGNANALVGPSADGDVGAVCQAVADALDIASAAVVSASTGIIGVRLPVQKIVAAAPALAAARGTAIELAAQAIMTTDVRVKLASGTLAVGPSSGTIAAVAKGSGMIAPELATVLAFLTTDLAVSPNALQSALSRAMRSSFEMLAIDGDMSTNDAVMILANGLAGNALIEQDSLEYESLCAVIEAVCVELAREVAEDGDGATKLIEVRMRGAPDRAIARELGRAVAGSTLVKAAVFGSDPNWGRVVAAIGARVGSRHMALDPTRADVRVQGVSVYEDGAAAAMDPLALRAKMREPTVVIDVDLRAGNESATAFGCDLSYDYVKINADYTSLTHASPDGTVARDDRLTNYSPGFKRALLVEALSYIARFSGTRMVVKYGGAAMVKESLKASFANDINLLRSAGLLPIVVHGGGQEIAHTLDKLAIRQSDLVDGMRVPDREDVKAVEMVLTGKINTELVSLLNQSSAHAVGLSGKDAGLLRARKLVGEGGRDLGMVGEVTSVNSELLEVLLDRKYVPVVSPVGLGEDGEGYSISSDGAAAEIAVAVRAEKLIYLTDVPGILDHGELLSELSLSAMQAKIADGTIRGGMLTKARAALRAISGGVASTHILDGRMPHSVIAELFTDRGVGTLIHRD